jgi:Ser/Thr protein kinase RdoA (MazF antagonist)
MASQAERLAELVAAGEAGLVAGLPRQLVHGDFWDDNVFFQGETLVFVADFAFMAERARIDDLALTLYYADTEAGLTTSQDRIAALRPLVHGYASGLGNPLTDAEHQALPWAIARQPLWGIAAGSRCSMTRTPPGRMPAPPPPPSAAPCSWSLTSAPGRPGYPDAGPARRPAERPVLRGDRRDSSWRRIRPDRRVGAQLLTGLASYLQKRPPNRPVGST